MLKFSEALSNFFVEVRKCWLALMIENFARTLANLIYEHRNFFDLLTTEKRLNLES